MATDTQRVRRQTDRSEEVLSHKPNSEWSDVTEGSTTGHQNQRTLGEEATDP